MGHLIQQNIIAAMSNEMRGIKDQVDKNKHNINNNNIQSAIPQTLNKLNIIAINSTVRQHRRYFLQTFIEKKQC